MEKKRFLFVSENGIINDLAWHVKLEGHDVKVFISDRTYIESGQGFIDKSDDWRADMSWADIIVFEGAEGDGARAEEARKTGKPVIGGNSYSDRLEYDRAFGQEELKSVGAEILPYYKFTTLDQGIDFIKENPGCYVFKPDGEISDFKQILFVGEDKKGKDVIQVLSMYKKTIGDKIESFQLQKKVTGVELGVGAFFNGHDFIMPININFEHKKLFPGNIGPSTIEMGTSMFWKDSSEIFDRTLGRMRDKLRESSYSGYIDVNCIIDEEGIHPLEFTPRFGYPTMPIQQESFITPTGEFLWKMATGQDFRIEVKPGFHLGVRIVVPPYPFKNDEVFRQYSKDVKIIFKKKDMPGRHIEDIKLVGKDWIIAGDVGAVMLVAGGAETMKKAQKLVYKRIENIVIPNMYYRNDIGTRWYKDIKLLKKWGYFKDMPSS